jgi:phosphoribosyl 1,2-cyclic phosphodiesterase
MMRMTVLASGSKGNSTVVSSSRTRVLVDAGLSCRELVRRMRLVGEEPESLNAILITHEHQDHVAGLGVLARKLNIPVYFTESTHRAWVRMLTPRTTMSYVDWLAHVQKEKEDRARATALATASEPPPGLCDSMTAAVEASCESLCEDPDADFEATESSDSTPDGVTLFPSSRPAPTHLPAVEYFRAGSSFTIGDIDITPFTIPHDAADPCGFVFASEGIRMAVAHRSRLHATQRQGRAASHRCPPPRVQPRLGDA